MQVNSIKHLQVVLIISHRLKQCFFGIASKSLCHAVLT